MATDTFIDKLDCTLSDEELAERKDRLATEYQALTEVQDEKADVMADYSKKIKGHQKVLAALIDAISTGKEKREVECLERRDDRLGVMQIIRGDTGEMVEERPLTLEERQVGMFDGSGEATH